MYVFNIDRFPDDTTVPTASYSGKAQVFKDYSAEWDKNCDADGNEDLSKNIYYRLTPLVPQFVDLYETIEREIPDKYAEYRGSNGGGASFGKVRGVTSKDGKDAKKTGEPFKSDFTESEMKYDISSGYIMPIFGAFRALLQDKDGKLTWIYDPKDVWETIGTRLVENTFETDHNPQMVGKSKTIWQANYRIVQTEKLTRQVAQLSR